MGKRLDSIAVGEAVTVTFQGSKILGNDSYTLDLVVAGREGTGDDRRVTLDEADGGAEFDVYRFQGRWAYGTSAERLSVA